MAQRRLLGAVALGALLVWLAVVVVIFTSDWSLTCTVDGQELGGIDCFQTNAIPQASSAPARWVGFVPLAALWVVATAALCTCALLAWWQRRARRSATA